MSNASDAFFSALAPSSDTLQTQKEALSNYNLQQGAKMLQKRPADAIPFFQRAIKINPDSVDAYNALGNVYLQLKKNDEAIDTFKKLARIKVTNPDVQISLGNAYSQAKKWSDAAQAYQKAVKFDPANTTAHYSLGQTYMLQNKLNQAEKEFQQVTRLKPNDGSGYYALGQVFNKMKNYDQAISNLKKAITLKHGDFILAETELGYAYAGKGDDYHLQQQIDKVKAKDSAAGLDLQKNTLKPKIANVSYGPASPFYAQLGANTPLGLLTATDPNQTLAKADASKDFTMVFHFNTDMDAKSIQDISQWRISKASGGRAGYYNNGYIQDPKKDTFVFPLPKMVTYDSTTRNATVTFTLKQNSNADGQIDPSHLVFKFSGKDINGKTMDTKGDEYDGFAGKPF